MILIGGFGLAFSGFASLRRTTLLLISNDLLALFRKNNLFTQPASPEASHTPSGSIVPRGNSEGNNILPIIPNLPSQSEPRAHGSHGKLAVPICRGFVNSGKAHGEKKRSPWLPDLKNGRI